MTNTEIALMKEYCGAVAVSFYTRLSGSGPDFVESNPETLNAINRLIKGGCTTNIHFVLSNDTISEAIIRLKEWRFPIGVNAVVFILYKPVGDGISRKMLDGNNQGLQELLELVQSERFPFCVGFDTCCSPALHMWGERISAESIDNCEAARFSMYIDCELRAYPCSFDCGQRQFAEDLNTHTISEVWGSPAFERFRVLQQQSCCDCNKRTRCQGGCVLNLGLNLCGKKGLKSL